MNRIGFMVNAGCFPTREAAEAKKKLLEQKGVLPTIDTMVKVAVAVGMKYSEYMPLIQKAQEEVRHAEQDH